MFKQDKEFIIQYLTTALWSSTDMDNNTPLDETFDLNDIDLNSIKRAIKDCLKFINDAEKYNLLDGLSYSTAGHDFWLTRNHHGAGFWDGDYIKKTGLYLTELSNEFKELDCIVYPHDLTNGINKIEIL